MTGFRIRRAEVAEADTLGKVMFDAIRTGASAYTEAQRQAWLPAPNHGAGWARRLTAQQVWLAEAGTDICGFITLAEGGYVDLAFVRPDAQGRGVFRALYAALERHAAGLGCTRLWTHASLTAQPAFLAFGFHAIGQENVVRHGEMLKRAKMEKPLP
ncbi:MAG: putative acetyltransferase [Sulfitobacter sp.]|jgi:putative acetyltransferase